MLSTAAAEEAQWEPERNLVTNIPDAERPLCSAVAHRPGTLASAGHGQQLEHRAYAGDKAG